MPSALDRAANPTVLVVAMGGAGVILVWAHRRPNWVGRVLALAVSAGVGAAAWALASSALTGAVASTRVSDWGR